jgi:ABC-type molybdate transport system substrate-binding protein
MLCRLMDGHANQQRAGLTIFNAANEKDAFAADVPEIEDAATIDVGFWSSLRAT